jgi:hypothetical protein
MRFSRFLLLATIASLLSNCSSYKEPGDGPIATLTCKQPPYASLIALTSSPVTRIAAVDGKKLPVLFVSAQQSIKIAAGKRVISATATAGPLRSGTSFEMEFKDGEDYSIQTLAGSPSHRYEVKDSKGKTIVTAEPVTQYQVAPPTMIFIPAG